MAILVELSPADWVVPVTPFVNTPELEVNPPNNVSLAAISTPSTVPPRVILLWTFKFPDPDKLNLVTVPPLVILTPNKVEELLLFTSPKTRCWLVLPCKFSKTDAFECWIVKPLTVEALTCWIAA